MTFDDRAVRNLVGRNGAAVLMLTEEEIGPLAVERSRTRRGARDAFERLQRRLIEPSGFGVAGEYPPGTILLVARVERGKVVDRIRVPPPSGGDEPDAGVREPRRPYPPEHGASATA